MRYKVGEEVDFDYDVYYVVNNVESEFDHTERMHGTITSVDSASETYVIKNTDDGYEYEVDEHSIITKTSILQKKLTEQKLKIADLALKVRDALWDDHPTRMKESQKAYDEAREELYDAMSEYDDIEDKIIMLNGK